MGTATSRSASATPEALTGMRADLVVLGPSNPVVSLMPVVAVPGVLEALLCASRVVGVSPVVEAVKPRTPPEAGRYRVRARLMEMLGLAHSADAVAGLWAGLVDGFVVDGRDVDAARRIDETLGIPVLGTHLLPMDRKGHDRAGGSGGRVRSRLAGAGRRARAEALVGSRMHLSARPGWSDPGCGIWVRAPRRPRPSPIRTFRRFRTRV